MKKNLKINVYSGSEMSTAKKEIIKYFDDIKKRIELYMNAMVSFGIDTAKNKVLAYDAFDSGELYSSISGMYNEDTGVGIILASSMHAAYVEFGTGIVGAKSQHPEAGNQGYAYDVHGHGDKGWWYLTDDFHWTKGMPSRPFMWETVAELQNNAKRIASEVFGSD